MADLSDSQRKRAEARDRRRKKQADDSGSDDVAQTVSANTDEQPNQAVRQAAKIAAAVGAAGAAAAAARVLSSHDENEQPEPEERNEPEQDEPQAREPELEQEREPEQEAEEEHEREPEEESREQVAGANQDDARRVLDRARDQLEDLLGRPVESVSSLERTHDGWVLALEVVEVRRVPETTDILASYELELDGDLNLRRYQQGRRYHRAHADGGGDR